jgi:LytS/YehU family sensor histidine kinase
MAFHAWVLHHYFELTWEISAWDAGVFNLTIASFAVLNGYLIRYFPKNGTFQIVTGTSLLLSYTATYSSMKVLLPLSEGSNEYINFLTSSEPIRWMIAFLLLASAGLLYLFYNRLKEVQDSHDREASTKVMVKEAELQKLQLQLQPHFLFNSLNSINALILTQPDKAGKMVQQLSDFLRATLKRADEQWITLSKEIEYLQLYLSIEKVRFGHRLDVHLNLDDQIQLWLIPPLLLQPLVENAIKFGLYGTTGPVAINISTQREGDSLVIEISNPFDEDMQPAEGSGFGISGLRRRLYLLYARNDLLTTRIDDSKFIVRLILPEKYD